MRKPQRPWTSEEEAFLAENYHRGSRWLVDNMDRPKSSILGKVRAMGLRIPKNRHDGWTEEEDQIIRENAHLGWPVLAKLLPGRSAYATQGRCSRVLKIPFYYSSAPPRCAKIHSPELRIESS